MRCPFRFHTAFVPAAWSLPLWHVDLDAGPIGMDGCSYAFRFLYTQIHLALKIFLEQYYLRFSFFFPSPVVQLWAFLLQVQVLEGILLGSLDSGSNFDQVQIFQQNSRHQNTAQRTKKVQKVQAWKQPSLNWLTSAVHNFRFPIHLSWIHLYSSYNLGSFYAAQFKI